MAQAALKKTLVWAAIWLALMVGFFGPTDNWAWDPSFYYGQLRSPIIDGDLNLKNEINTGDVILKPTSTGLISSAWPIGPGLLWAPFFLAAHLITLAVDPAQANGYSSLYISFVSAGSVIYAVIGLVITRKICKYLAQEPASFLSSLLCLFASPLFFYTFHQPIMAHAGSFACSAAMLLYFVFLARNNTPSSASGMVFGALVGLNFLMRWSGLLYLFFPLIYFLFESISACRAKEKAACRRLAIQFFVMALCLVLTLSPQLAFWQKVNGTFVTMPQQASSFAQTALPVNLIAALVGTNRGILFWSPFVVMGLFGLLFVPNRKIKIAAIGFSFLQIILIGYRADWFGGGGFGPRYFIELLPCAALGFAVLIQRVFNRKSGPALVFAVASGLIFHHALLVYAVEHGSDGWIDLGLYFTGQPLGLQWQLDAFLRLIQRPALWLMPRPFVGQGRQTILVNMALDVDQPSAYAITGMAALAMLAFALLARPLRAWLARLPISLFAPALMAYMLAWMARLLTLP